VRHYWDGDYWNAWLGVVKKQNGSTCYGPAGGYEGTYYQIQSSIGSTYGYYWKIEGGAKDDFDTKCTHLPPP
jgi:hypothetical protein